MLFRETRVNGETMDVRVRGDRIEAVGAPGTLPAEPGEPVRLNGALYPPSAEPHVHLDAALLGGRAPNRSGTLREGIANWAELRPGLSFADVQARARTVLGWYLAHGTLRVRTHVDTGSTTAVEALLALREEVRGWMELQVVAFPQEGILRSPGRREAWEDAVRMGCDAVGCIPHFERTTEEGWHSVRLAFDLAERFDRRLDFHCDETDDPGSRNLEVVCAQALDRGWASRPGAVVAGHCTSLHSQPEPYAAKVCELVAASGVLVVANPLDNVVLQGRYDSYPRRRGMTRVDQLWAAGAAVGFGHDSVIDPWYPLGTANLLDAAYMAVHLGHLTGTAQMERAVATLHRENHLPFGEPPRVEVGARAALVWYPGGEVEALRTRRAGEVYVRGERLG